MSVCCGIILRKVNVLPLDNKFPSRFWNPKFRRMSDRSRRLITACFQSSHSYPILYYANFNIILPFMPIFLKVSSMQVYRLISLYIYHILSCLLRPPVNMISLIWFPQWHFMSSVYYETLQCLFSSSLVIFPWAGIAYSVQRLATS